MSKTADYAAPETEQVAPDAAGHEGSVDAGAAASMATVAGPVPVAPDLLQRIIEGALLTAGKPLAVADFGGLFEEHERPGNDAIRQALAALAEQYAGRGVELKEVASGFRLQVVQEVAPWIARMWEERPQRYSRALLETLALIAYRQPITRGDIEEIRGVAVASNIMKTLLEREWVRIVGHKDVPGRPALYATTRKFLDYFDLKNLDQLPTLAEIRDLDSFTGELALEGADTVQPDSDDAATPDREGATVAAGETDEADVADDNDANVVASASSGAKTTDPDTINADEPERGNDTAADDDAQQGDAPADK